MDRVMRKANLLLQGGEIAEYLEKTEVPSQDEASWWERALVWVAHSLRQEERVEEGMAIEAHLEKGTTIVVNYLKAYEFIFKSIWQVPDPERGMLSVTWLLHLHEILSDGLAGKQGELRPLVMLLVDEYNLRWRRLRYAMKWGRLVRGYRKSSDVQDFFKMLSWFLWKLSLLRPFMWGCSLMIRLLYAYITESYGFPFPLLWVRDYPLAVHERMVEEVYEEVKRNRKKDQEVGEG